uniref:CABIT domain-containing protein n=1 Tax=Salmo trutta TaxID=8032 RepID=A0A673WRW1_SALTR
MAGTETVMSLQEFIASLDQTCLPRILQVCSGVYFQGSVYELSGSEVCLSTGDLVKVIDIELLSVSCEDTSNNDKFELPINHAVKFPSSLEVDVVDVTTQSQDLTFVTPLTLLEVFAQPDE